MKNLQDTYTDSEFRKSIKTADTEWMAGLARPEPDLEVEALTGSLISRVLALFGSRKA